MKSDKLFRNSLIITAIMALPLAASAETYVSATGGLSLLTDSEFEDSGITGEFSFDPGIALLGAVGYKSPNTGARIEAEFGFRYNEIDEVSVDGLGSSSNFDGDTTTLSFMINGYYDFVADGISPYVMGGVGFANVDGTLEFAGVESSADDTVFAYQFGAGASFPLGPTVFIDGGYRYFATEDANLDGTEIEYATHNLLVGVRAHF